MNQIPMMLFLLISFHTITPAIKDTPTQSPYSIFLQKKAPYLHIPSKKELQDIIIKNVGPAWGPQHFEQAKVRTGNAISSGEQNAINRRLNHVKQAITKKIGTIKQVPKIAVITSGGGLRATIVSLAALLGLHKIGFLDTVTWISSLSGSSWTVATWMQSLLKNPNLTLPEFKKQLINTIASKQVSTISIPELRRLTTLLLVNKLYDMPLTIVDLYGGLLANMFLKEFGPERQVQKLSSQMSVLSNDQYPIPIYSTVNGDKERYTHWYAFTPWEISLEPSKPNAIGFSIPSWAFGRPFENGISTAITPEKSLGFNLGVFGSAFATDLITGYQKLYEKKVIGYYRKKILDTILSHIGSLRISPGIVYNFMKGLSESPFDNLNVLRMVDAGSAFDLPYQPVSGLRSERKPDILIFIDASAHVHRDDIFPLAKNLHKAEGYARSKGLYFPKISYDDITKQAVSIFYDKRSPQTPMVIYIPLVKDETLMKKLHEPAFAQYKDIIELNLLTCCSTLRGMVKTQRSYSRSIIEKLINLMEFNIVANESVIWDALAKKAA